MLKRSRLFCNPNQLDLFDWESERTRHLLPYPANYIQKRFYLSPYQARVISELCFGGVQP